MHNPDSWHRSAQVYLLLTVLMLAVNANTQNAKPNATKKVTIVAGGFNGNNKPATSAALARPLGIAVDKKGNIYVTDSVNCEIRKINTKGIIGRFAGTRICGYSGDGGPAYLAEISFPSGLTFDGEGNLLFADFDSQRIRKITPSGTISTIAGNGTSGYSGDGGPATQASIASPQGVFADSVGNVYIADTFNCVIRMVDTSGVIHTVAGNHTCGFSGDGGPATSAELLDPLAVVADGDGSLYIADTSNSRVRKLDASGVISTYAGNGSGGNAGNGGPATSAGIGAPSGLVLRQGSLYVSTGSNIWAVNQSTQIISLVAGNATGSFGFGGDGGPALSATFNGISALAFDNSGNLLGTDSSNARVRKIDSSQNVTTIVGGYIGDGGPALQASLNLDGGDFPLGGRIAFDTTGTLYIADSLNNRVRKVATDGTITTIAGTGVTGYSGDGGAAVSATLNWPQAAVADGTGNVFVSDLGNGVIRKIDSAGVITTFAGLVGGAPAQGLATDAQGNLYAADGINAVWKITPSGAVSQVNKQGLPFPIGIALDAAGNIYAAQWASQTVSKIDASGAVFLVAGNGKQGFSGDGGPATAAMLDFPLDVALDSEGNLYIADWLNLRIRVVDTSGTIQTLAGTGNGGYNGNGLAASQTNLFPVALAVGHTGTIYVTDVDSDRVRKIH